MDVKRRPLLHSQFGNNDLLEDESMIDSYIRATANEEHGSNPNNKFPGGKLAIDDGGGKLSPEDKEEETNHNNIIPGNKGNIEGGGGKLSPDDAEKETNPNNIIPSNKGGINCGSGKLSPEEVKEAAQKARSEELSPEVEEFCADVFNVVMRDMEKTFPSEPKCKDLSSEQKQFLIDLTISCLSSQPLEVEKLRRIVLKHMPWYYIETFIQKIEAEVVVQCGVYSGTSAKVQSSQS